ncbi:MAG TPA: hypothetical protein VHQ66_09845 [Myxococcota bacterium]|nr:hypothetical protein [Myxococcota bacterium]
MEPLLLAKDLAPGDRALAHAEWGDVAVHRVRGAVDPDFTPAYQRLWAAFGARGEMERRVVIEERIAWDPARPTGASALAYELLVVRRDGEIAALRDHTAVVRLDGDGRPLPGPVVVHLSHAFVEPPHRGSGLAGWLRALPLQAARRCAAAAGASPEAAIVLVAEMEPLDPAEPGRGVRLRSYERAGFLKVDPEAAPYSQPDFRPAEEWPAGVPEALRLGLVLRRVGREDEREMPADELAAVVDAVYSVYGVHVPAVALDPLRADAMRWCARRARFPLLPPTR